MKGRAEKAIDKAVYILWNPNLNSNDFRLGLRNSLLNAENPVTTRTARIIRLNPMTQPSHLLESGMVLLDFQKIPAISPMMIKWIQKTGLNSLYLMRLYQIRQKTI